MILFRNTIFYRCEYCKNVITVKNDYECIDVCDSSQRTITDDEFSHVLYIWCCERVPPTLHSQSRLMSENCARRCALDCQDLPSGALSWGLSVNRTIRWVGALSSSSTVMLLGELALSKGPGTYRVCWGPLAGQYRPRFLPLIQTWPCCKEVKIYHIINVEDKKSPKKNKKI